MSDGLHGHLHKLLYGYKQKGLTVDKVFTVMDATGTHLSGDQIEWVKEFYPTIEVKSCQPQQSEKMSEADINKFKDSIAEAAQYENRKQAVQKMELDVRESKVQVDIVKYKQQQEDILKSDAERKAAQSLNVDQLKDAYFSDAMTDHQKYLESAKYRLRCMLPCFDNTVPLFAKNLLLLGAKTGEGKSSTAAQIIYSVLNQNNPATGRPCRALVLTNEETMGEVYTRVAFQYKKWPYTRLDAISEGQRKEVLRFQNEMRDSKRLVVIDNSFPDIRQPTTSLEGLEHFLESLVRNKNDFDLIVIDYFQKISSSTAHRGASPTDVFTRVCDMLDDYRKRLNCPIVIFAQLYPSNSDKTNFEDRIKGRKKILETATFAAEIEPDRDNYKTYFRIHKNRLVQGTVGTTVTVGFDRETGMYVTCDIPFQQKASQWKQDRKIKVAQEVVDRIDDNLSAAQSPVRKQS
ncbi:MAG: DnaB-like helicase C-terminal domain-containing protein [Bdellovibrionales bacterium]